MNSVQAMLRHLGQARLRAGLSQESVAAALGLERHTVSDWETGRKTPTVANVAGFAEILGLVLALRDAPAAPPAGAAHRLVRQMKTLRIRRSWSQLDLAVAADLEQDRISRWETGTVLPTLAVFARAVTALDSALTLEPAPAKDGVRL